METVTQGMGASETEQRVVRAATDAAEKGSRVWEDTLDNVRRSPAQTLGMAVLAGVALGALSGTLMARRSRSESLYANLTKGIDQSVNRGFSSVKDLVCDLAEKFSR